MAETSTLTIKLGGVPVVGAEVITSASTTIAITDDNGKISAPYANDYANCTMVAVRHSSIPEATYVAVCVLEAGEDYEINLPTDTGAESSGELYGISSHFVKKLQG